MKEGTNVKPVSVDELTFAMKVFENAAAMKTPRPNPEMRRTGVVDEAGNTSIYKLADRPQNRGLLAVTDHYKEQGTPEEDRHAIAWRVMCVSDILNHPLCQKWVRESQGVLEIDDAVIEALASFPMQYGRDIEMTGFCQLVEKRAA